MEESVYAGMMERISAMVSGCRECSSVLLDPEAVGSMQVERYNSLCRKARQLQADCDRILRSELYHIIGMGNLTPGQLVGFAGAIAELGSYRSALKRVASARYAGFGGSGSADAGEDGGANEPEEFRATCLLGGAVLRSDGTVSSGNE